MDFSRWEITLLYLIPAGINLAIYLYVIFKSRKTRLNTFFGLFVLFLSIWQIAEALVKFSVGARGAGTVHRISEVAILLVVVFGIKFIASLTKWKRLRHNYFLSFFLFVPVTIFVAFILIGGTKYNIVPSPTWYWIANPIPNLITTLLFGWIAIVGLFMVAMLLLFYFMSRKQELKRKQALLLLCGLAIPVFGGIIAEVIFPFVLRLNDIPITATLATAFSTFAVISIKNYGMLDYSPKHHWSGIAEQMSEGILIVDTEDRIMYANNSFCKTTGYKFEEIQGKIAEELFLDEVELSKIEKALRDNQNGKSGDLELQVRGKGGEKIWLKVSSAPYRDMRGKIVGSIGIQTNITEKKKHEEYLKHNEFRLRQAQAVAQMGSWELNFNTGIVSWSEEACRIYGLPVSEREKQTIESWLSFIHPEDLKGVKDEIEKQQKNFTNASFKHRIIRSDGKVRHIHSVANFEFNHTAFPIGLFGICHDITEQIEAEKALKESEGNVRTFIDESLLSIYFIDPSKKEIIYSNPALSELLGYTESELKTMSPYDFINHSKEDVDARIKEVMTLGRINNGERQWKRKDGKIINVLVNSFYHSRNGADAIYIAAQDITERKKAEEKLAATNKELELFIYKTAHDIRGPLASVMGLVNISKYEIEDETAIKYLNMINLSAKKLDYTLAELMNAMRIKYVSDFSEDINFPELVDGVITKLTHIDGFESLKISKEMLVTETFYSNRSILETILKNLIENSIKYQKKSDEERYLKISITGDTEKIKIVIEDNGIGIDEIAQSSVFDMYFRAHENSQGPGLGLYLVKKAVEKVNGEVLLSTKKGLGTTVEVWIPGQ